MTGQIAYEAVLLQFTPRLAGEERLNVGVVVFGPVEGRLLHKVSADSVRIRRVFPQIDALRFHGLIRQIQTRLEYVAHSGSRSKQRGFDDRPSLELILPDIVRPGSLSFAWSTTKRGISDSLESVASELYREHVVASQSLPRKERREDSDVWRSTVASDSFQTISPLIDHRVRIEVPDYSYVFHGGWQNGTQHVLEPISLDYSSGDRAIERATHWAGRLHGLRESDFSLTAIVTDPPKSNSARNKYDQARRILASAPNFRMAIEEAQVDDRLGSTVLFDLSHAEIPFSDVTQRASSETRMFLLGPSADN